MVRNYPGRGRVNIGGSAGSSCPGIKTVLEYKYGESIYDPILSGREDSP